MAKRKAVRKTVRKAAAKRPRKAPARRAQRKAPPAAPDSLVGPMKGVLRRSLGHVKLEVGRAGAARVKRVIYPPGFKWSVDMKPVTGTDLCMHAHVGFLARGRFHVQYADGCKVECKAPEIVVIEPGHDGWVVGSEPAVLIEFDFEGETISRLGMPDRHRHEPDR